jgi:hypothetical protein
MNSGGAEKHETLAAGAAIMRSLYIRPDRSPAGWADPVPVAVPPVLAGFIGYLDSDTLDTRQRAVRRRCSVTCSGRCRWAPSGSGCPKTSAPRRSRRGCADPADGRTLAE